LASFLDARHQAGLWRLRIDDLDTPRNVPGATDAILRLLDALGLHWDGAVLYQSQRLDRYRAALDDLMRRGLLYRCACSRKTLADLPSTRYPGFCRTRDVPPHLPHALRVCVPQRDDGFDDALQGRFDYVIAERDGDFIVDRRDGVIAYQLAAAVDDGAGDISEVLRGIDLIDSTPKQRYLQQCLGLTSPRYGHLPVLVNAQGQKLSKQTFAAPVTAHDPSAVLWRALQLLRQSPPAALRGAPTQEVLAWAIAHWQLAALRGKTTLPAPSVATSLVSNARKTV